MIRSSSWLKASIMKKAIRYYTRSLLIATLLVAIVFSWIGFHVTRSQSQLEVAEIIRRADGARHRVRSGFRFSALHAASAVTINPRAPCRMSCSAVCRYSDGRVSRGSRNPRPREARHNADLHTHESPHILGSPWCHASSRTTRGVAGGVTLTSPSA